MLLDEWDAPTHSQADYGGSMQPVDKGFDDEDKMTESINVRAKVDAPIFRLLKQDWEPTREQGPIVSVSVGDFMMILGTENSYVARWNMKTEAIESLSLPRKGEDKIYKVFIDPSGNHCIISCVSGANYYLHSRTTKFMPLTKWKGVTIESVGWDKNNKSEATTKRFLVGSNTGMIFEAIIDADKEKHFNKIYDLIEDPDRTGKVPISGLEFDVFPSNEAKFLIMIATPTRHYQFIGGPSLEAALATYLPTPKAPAKALPKFIELPCTLEYSSMQTYQAESGVSSLCAWLTGVGVFYCSMAFGEQNPGDGVFSQSKLLPFPSQAIVNGVSALSNPSDNDQGVPPLSLSLTEFHFLLLYRNRLLAINQLSEEVVWSLPVQDRAAGALLGFARDPTHQCIFAFSDRAVFEIGIDREDRDVWRLYLEEGDFEAALRHCHDTQQQEKVREAEADMHFSKGQFEHAARLYAQTSRSFEEVALRFVHREARNALRVFLLTRLQRTDAKKDLTQRVMLCTWLTELFLDQLNQLKDRNSDEYEQCVNEFRDFLTQYQAYLQLNRETTFELIASHGRIDELLFYANLIGEHERVLEYHLQRGNHDAALTVLESLKDDISTDELFYKYSPILMHFVPERMVDVLMKVEFLDACKLIPALMRYESSQQQQQSFSSSSQSAPSSGGADSQAIRFLNHCVTVRKNTDPAIHNYLLALYAKVPGHLGERVLLKFIESQGDAPAFDLKYALRLCHQEHKTRACVSIYTIMGLYEEAVQLALSPECNDLELAKRVAETPTADDEFPAADKKKIWLLIARHIIEQQHDIGKAIAVMKEYQQQQRLADDPDADGSEQLRIEDILPFFPDFAKIADFKDEICDSLDQYNAHIEKLKEEMEEHTKNADLIRKDIAQLRNRYGFVGAGQKCDLCMQPVLTRSFLVFPCSHVFHTDCVTVELDRHLNPGARKAAARTKALPSASEALNDGTGAASSSFSSFFGDHKVAETPVNSAEEQLAKTERERLQKLEETAAAECLFCGEFMINSITEPFVSPDEVEESESWAI